MHDIHPMPAASTCGRRLARRLTGGAAIAVLLAGCTTPMTYSANFSSNLGSATVKDALAGNTALRAIPYFLPKTVLPYTLTGKLSDTRTDADKAKKGSTPEWSYAFTLTLDAATQVADATSPLLLVYNPEAATEDQFTLAVNDKGLLTTVKNESTDNTPQIITSIADLAGRLAGGAVMPLVKTPDKTKPDQKAVNCGVFLKDFAYSGFIDLADPAASRTLNRDVLKAMSNAGAKINMASSNLMGINESGAVDTLPMATESSLDIAARQRGVVFRATAPRTFVVSLTPNGIVFDDAGATDKCTPNQAARSTTLKSVMVTDPGRYFSVDTTRGALVHKTIAITVTDGNLTGIDVHKPSELAALFGLPASVIDTFSKAVLGGLTGSTTVTQDQVNYLTQQLALIKARQDLQAAQAAAAKPPASSP